MNWLAGRLARALRKDERDAVLGDLEEACVPGWAAALQVAGLVGRRQAAEWRHPGPWLALFGITGAAGIAIGGLAKTLTMDASLQSRTWWKYGVRYGTGLSWEEDLAVFVCLAAAVMCWAWMAGFALHRLSGKATWLTGGLLLIGAMLFGGLGLLIPAWFGMRRGRANGWPRVAPLACLALAGPVWWAQVVKSQALARWIDSGWQPRGPNAWDALGLAMACWPAVYVLVSRKKEAR